jgi:2-polyprenyl-3-methyl-5-hydroxy-6-metoxy-1,4-benzoquinol methylase
MTVAEPVPMMVEISTAPRRCIVCGHESTTDLLQAPDRFHGEKEIYRLVQCTLCKLVWLANAPRPEQMYRHYGHDYDQKIAEAGERSPQRWRDRREMLIEYKRGGAILDLGCSSGSFLSTLNSGDWDMYGVEMSTESAERALARCGAKVFVGDILDAPFEPESFDVITCFHVFEHLYHPREVLARISQWLKPGGIFYTLMPNIDSAGAKVFKSYWYALELPRHLYHFSPKSLSALARSVGLEEVTMITGRELFIEKSYRYMVDDALLAVGIHRAPLSKSKEPSFAWKVMRKMYRLTVQPMLTALIGIKGDGESIHAVFRKRSEGHNGSA